MKKLLNILAVLISFVNIVPLYSLEVLNSPEQYVRYHNMAREYVSSPPLSWDPKLETLALNFLNKHKIDCLGKTTFISGGIGWNIACYMGNMPFYGATAVKHWFKEINNYDHKTNKCVDDDQCLSYTQVVWKNSTRLGCARAKCHVKGIMVMCNYDPPGNIPGQRPY
ncbi:hypothetical protein PIB30_035453 [Stylosanthes scabra]|uniref:SCP domain-containing protein n=1 Tax=Stylosanthes scabra TaxID=79078 RepID=A0ABU6UDN0_9FABA|nr:hypothetical protein [Stylosanthes scabra]